MMLCMRITSTYVENTPLKLIVVLSSEDHLHIRGEYSLVIKRSFFMLGSPPHTWRIPIGEINKGITGRITSTYVENTKHTVYVNKTWKDHLHIRGEYNLINFTIKQRKGSPPHTWRIPVTSTKGCLVGRITSTYVENTDTQRIQSITH